MDLGKINQSSRSLLLRHHILDMSSLSVPGLRCDTVTFGRVVDLAKRSSNVTPPVKLQLADHPFKNPFRRGGLADVSMKNLR